MLESLGRFVSDYEKPPTYKAYKEGYERTEVFVAAKGLEKGREGAEGKPSECEKEASESGQNYANSRLSKGTKVHADQWVYSPMQTVDYVQ